MNGALPRMVLCSIFWEGLELKPPALVIILKWWIGEKSLRIPRNCLDEGCGGGGHVPRGSVQLFPVEDPRFLLETRKLREGSLVHPPLCFTGVLTVAASAVAQEAGTP